MKINTLILVSAVSIIALAGCAAGNSGQKDEVSGEYYDYTVTMQPERPYMLEYDRAMMMKLFLARPDGKGGSNVGLTFSEVLEVIKGMDVLSRGIPKIVYLVGWQYEGHDWKYPALNPSDVRKMRLPVTAICGFRRRRRNTILQCPSTCLSTMQNPILRFGTNMWKTT